MGLDISHIKATLQRPNTSNPNEIRGVTEELFDMCGDFDVPFSFFEKYIQEIDWANIVAKNLVIVKEEKYLKETINWFKTSEFSSEYEVIFEKNESALQKTLQVYKQKNNFNNLHEYLDSRTKEWDILYHYEIVKKIGYYEIDVGYQRKGMNGDFVEFCNGEKTEFVLREDFEKAYKCIDFFWDSDTIEEVAERKLNFKENFLDKYEFGSSSLSLSY